MAARLGGGGKVKIVWFDWGQLIRADTLVGCLSGDSEKC